MSRKAPRYKFRTIEDLQGVPLEKLDAFMTDLKAWLLIQRVAEKNPALKMNGPTNCFEWIDDGRHDVKVTISVREVPL